MVFTNVIIWYFNWYHINWTPWSLPIPLSTISTGLPTFGENYLPSYYHPYAGGQPLVTQYDITQSLFGQTNIDMNVFQWHPTLPIQPQTVVHSYQPVQPITPTSLPLVNTSIPLL